MSAKTCPASPPRKHRILLVDDHAIVREGFAELINSHADLETCGQAGSAPEAMSEVEKLKPDMVVVDLSLQGGSGLDLIKNLKALHPFLRLLVLSMHDEALYGERALRAGALGYVMKREDSATFLQAVRDVLDGRVFLSQVMRERLLLKAVGEDVAFEHSGMTHLSDRELEVFQLIGDGHTTHQIAAKLHLSVSTVETHRAHLKEKLHLANGTDLICRAVEWVKSQQPSPLPIAGR
jgi:DNA-binding NarL/FixJ family response regulator